ncbi:MAG TPA: hypothetical protein VN709_02735 [Terriglobales bacterium]|nr:hypothetical protein [Terriglobales bacterium]
MIVFRHHQRRTTLGALRGDKASYECALADHLWREHGADDWRGDGWTATVDDATPVPLPEPEGLRFYALWPEGFGRAARRWRATHSEPCWALGLRTMGSFLLPAIDATRGSSLRPVGPPGERRIAATKRLRGELARWSGRFLIVDEGPGLSGSSFAAAVRLLREVGIAEQRITLLASWRPAGEQLACAYAACGWDQWQVLVADAIPPPADGADDISAGEWRRSFGSDEPVWPQHERRKFLINGGRAVAKFAGAGAYGAATLERARALARAGFGPPTAPGADEAIGEGWLLTERVAAAPARATAAFVESVARYLAWVRAEYALGPACTPSAELRAMAAANVAALTGREWRGDVPGGVPVAVDGRMLAQEWGETGAGFVKFDATDHGDDPFFPGPADIAWDLAGIGIEFGRETGSAIVSRYQRLTGEREGDLSRRVQWHEAAYCAFRAGFCALAARQTSGSDSAKFARRARSYGASLVKVLPGGWDKVNVLGSGKGRLRTTPLELT